MLNVSCFSEAVGSGCRHAKRLLSSVSYQVHCTKPWVISPTSLSVCVDHLKRCKTSFVSMMIGFRGFRFWIILAGGCRECHSSAANEDGYDILWYRSGTLDRRTCYQFSRQWQPAKPSTGMSFGFPFLHNGQCCIRTFLRTSIATGFKSTVRFSQSDLLLTSSDGTVAFCKNKERILLHWFSRQVIQFLLSDFRGLFVHARCTPQQ